VPYYIILKLNLIAEDNIVEKVESDILSLETWFYQFIKYDLPLWLFKCNIMLPNMILNRENGAKTTNHSPSMAKVWSVAYNHMFFESSTDCCISLEPLDFLDEVI